MFNIFLLSSTFCPSEDKEQTRKWWRRNSIVLTQQDSLCGLCFFSLVVCFMFYVLDLFFFFLIHLFIDFSLFIRRVYLTVSTLQHVVNLVIKSRSPSARLRRITLSQSDPASRLHYVSQDGTTLIAVSVCLPAEVTFDLACGCQTCGICRRQVCVVRRSRGILHFGGICCLKPGIN